MENQNKNEIVRKMADCAFYPVPAEEKEKKDVSRRMKLPLTEISAFGAAFAPLAEAFQNTGAAAEVTQLYTVTIPEGTHLGVLASGAGNFGAVYDAGNKMVGQAVINPAASMAAAPVNPLILDPAMLLMAVALANMDKKLDKIQEMQKEILDYLVQKQRSDLMGDVKFLEDVFQNYKYNWNNEKYKDSYHIKVLDIRQDAEKNIDFYRKQIASKIKKNVFIHGDQDVKRQLDGIKPEFKDYELALYLFAFSSFLEVMLLENFDSAFLNGVVKRIEDHLADYQALYYECCHQIEENARSTVQAQFLNGLANANIFAGKALAKIPVISQSQIDESLVGTGGRLEEYGRKRAEQTAEQLQKSRDDYVGPFIDNIKMVDALYNHPVEVVFDKENIYLERP